MPCAEIGDRPIIAGSFFAFGSVLQMPLQTPYARWRPASWLRLHLIALFILGTWLWAPTHTLWNALDHTSFHALNGTLGHVLGWDLFWALASTRVWDVLVGGLMLCLFIQQDWVFPKAGVRHALFTFLGVLLALVVVRVAVTKLGEYLGWQHASPSIQLAAFAHHLSDQFPMIEQALEIKDRSSKSFPGDHASVLLAWGLFMSMFCRGRTRALFIGLALFLCMPRLIAGAHWMSDDFASGLAIALISIAWGYHTPFGAWIAAMLEWLAKPFLGIAQYIPVLRRMAVLQR
jgi:membrane-associated phospholipid phosphatase